MTLEERVKQLEEIQIKTNKQLDRLIDLVSDLVVLLEKDKSTKQQEENNAPNTKEIKDN